MKKNSFLIVVLVAFATNTYSQSTFQIALGAANVDVPYGTVIAPDGSFVFGGDTFRGSNYSLYANKLSVNGALVWSKTYTSGSSLRSAGVKNINTGGFALVGTRISGAEDMYLAKINNAGSLMWAKTYGSAGSEVAYDILNTADNGFVIVGETNVQSGSNNIDMAIVKTDATGAIQWINSYAQTGSRSEGLYNAIQLADGTYTATGYMDNIDGTYAIAVLHIAADGSLLWFKKYEVTNFQFSFGKSLVSTSDGGYMLTGSISNGSSKKVYNMRLTSVGDVVYIKSYGTQLESDGNQIIKTANGNFLIAGSDFAGPTTSTFNETLLTLNGNGDLLELNSYGGITNDDVNSGGVAQTFDGGFVFSGQTQSFGAGVSDFLVTRVDAAKNSGLGCNLMSPTYTTTTQNTTVTNTPITTFAFGTTTDVTSLTTEAIASTTVTVACQQVPIVLALQNIILSAKVLDKTSVSLLATIENTNSQAAKYVFESSTTGINFKTIQTFENTSTDKINVTDNYPAQGVNYYRVKCLDGTGRSLYSNIIAIKLDERKSYLTFTNGNLILNGTNAVVQISVPNNSKTNLLVYNSYGAVVYSSTLTQANSSHIIPTSKFAAGSYRVVLFNNNTIQSKNSFIIQ